MPQPFINPNYFNNYQYQNPVPMDRLQQLQSQYQMQPVQPMGPVQQNNNGILWVQGEAAAKAYLVTPGTSVLLMDSDDSVFYIKTVDGAGMPQPLRVFKYNEVGSNTKSNQTDLDMDIKYVTRNEYEDLIMKYEKIYEMLDTATRPDSPSARKEK